MSSFKVLNRFDSYDAMFSRESNKRQGYSEDEKPKNPKKDKRKPDYSQQRKQKRNELNYE